METNELTVLAESGRQLLQETNFNTSKMNVWSMQARRTLERLYDKEVADMFDHALNGSVVIMNDYQSDYDVYSPKIRQGVEYLESLIAVEMPKQADQPVAPSTAPQHFHVSGGNVQVGNGNTVNVNNVTIGDVLNTLEKQIETTTLDGTEKRGVLTALKSLTTNPTFTAVASQTLGTLLAHIGKV